MQGAIPFHGVIAGPGLERRGKMMTYLLAFLPSVIVVGAVLKQSKNVSALAQLGSLAGRSDEIDGVVRDDSAKKKAIDVEAEKIKDIDKLVCISTIGLRVHAYACTHKSIYTQTFTVAAFNIGMTCFWFGRWPETFYMWHIPKVCPPSARTPVLTAGVWGLSSPPVFCLY